MGDPGSNAFPRPDGNFVALAAKLLTLVHCLQDAGEIDGRRRNARRKFPRLSLSLVGAIRVVRNFNVSTKAKADHTEIPPQNGIFSSAFSRSIAKCVPSRQEEEEERFATSRLTS